MDPYIILNKFGFWYLYLIPILEWQGSEGAAAEAADGTPGVAGAAAAA